MEFIKTHIDERGVATITLDRADVHNAFNAALIAELHDTITSLGADKTVRVIILTGAGKSFSAGADLNWMKEAANYSQEDNHADALRLSDMLFALYQCPKPTIALVNGPAFGGGVGLVACCDMAVAVRSAIFSLSEVKLGLAPSTISPFVVEAMGAKICKRLFITAERFTPEKAKFWGLVSEVASDIDYATAVAEGLISNILKGGPQAQASCKTLIQSIAGRTIDTDLREETARHIAARRASDEGKEGLDAFLSKRNPNWVDKS